MNGYRESDSPIISEKPSNKTDDNKAVAEKVEKRGLAERNPSKRNRNQAQIWIFLPNELDRIRHAAQRNKGEQFISLWHHVYDIRRLRRSFLKLKRKSAPGIDGKTWKEYGKNLGDNLKGLSERLRKGAYRARAVKRTYISKDDGRQRPIGIPALEDKIVQRAMVEVLNAVYEVDFLGFSYGFRPQRSPHNALDAVVEAIEGRKVNWVLDLDIRGFFDAIDHEWLIKERGEGKPDTFDFLGFSHICSKSRRGKFTVLRKTSAKKLRNKLSKLKKTMRQRLHWSIPDLGKWLKSVIVGHCRYYGVPWNGKSLTRFRSEIIRMWCRSLRRRSQKHRITWKRMSRIAKRWLPNPFICHPYPLQRMRVNT